MEQERSSLYKCIIEAPDGSVFIGRGESVVYAYKEALSQINAANTPRRGRGMWEQPSEEGNK